VKTRCSSFVAFVELTAARVSVVSGPASVKGDETLSVSVYGGPCDPLPKVALLERVRAQEKFGLECLRSRF
jgi:hypothetical protein